MPIDPRQYDSAIDFIQDDTAFTRLTKNLSNNDDRLRLKAYELYEDMYSNRPEHMRVVMRGEDDDAVEIYLPSAKKCIEAVNRFLAIGFDYVVDPDSGTGLAADGTEVGPAQQHDEVDNALAKLFQEQEIPTKFNNMKRYMLVKGDALLHIRAIPFEKPGRKICVDELKPEHYFPIEDFVTGRPTGCHIVDIIRNPRNSRRTKEVSDEWIVRRQTYRYEQDDKGVYTGRVTSRLALFKIGHWDDRIADSEIFHIEDLQKEFLLDPGITRIPVYHWKNSPPPGSTFGMSELAGTEPLVAALNQAATDEDLTLVTQGLGVYWTDASPPVDENGDEVEWEIGPGAVVQVATGANFGRVSGVSSVQPFQEHMKMLDENMQQAMSVPDVAIGMVDVQAVESGIALQLKFGPLLAHTAEKEPSITKVTDEFLDDLLDWLQVYEGVQRSGVTVSCVFGDPMPQNKSQQLTDYLSIWTQANAGGQIMPVQWLYDRLNELFGWDLSDVDFEQALEDAKKISEATTPPDPFGGQMQDQMNQDGQGGNPPPQPPPGPNGNKLDLATMLTG